MERDVDGFSTSMSLLADTSITHSVAMEGKGAWSLTGEKYWLMDMILRWEPYINFTGASGMDVLASQAHSDVASQGLPVTSIAIL